jgi:hypothetical protein
VEYRAGWAKPTETSELTVTDPEPDAPVESAVTDQAAAVSDQAVTDEATAVSDQAVTDRAAAVSDQAAAPPSERRRSRPTRVQVLALVGAFLLGACLCGGLGLAIGAAVFHHHVGFSERGDFGPRGRNGEGRNGDGRNGRDGGQRQIRPIKPTPAPSATVPLPTVPLPTVPSATAPSPAVSVTPATSPS